MSSLITDTGVVFSRELRPMLRNPFTAVFSMVQPLVFLGLFAPLMPAELGLQRFVPGIVFSGQIWTATTAWGVVAAAAVAAVGLLAGTSAMKRSD